MPTTVVPARTARTTTSGEMLARRRRGLIAAAIGLLLLGAVVGRLSVGTGSGTGAAPGPTPVPTATVVPFAPLAGPPLTASRVLGQQAHLSNPREAVALPNGHIAVADTGNHRLVLLNSAGHLLRAIARGAGPLQDPYALAAAGHTLYLLDAGLGAIERYDGGGNFQGELIRNVAALQDARGLTTAPDGTIYVASPLANIIVVISTAGKIVRQFSGPAGAAPFAQPSDVAARGSGPLYILDNQNVHIDALNPATSLVAQWTTTSSDTLHSVHLLPLADGRLLATDPAGALLVYPPASGSNPTRLPLGIRGAAGPIQPLGIAPLHSGAVLVTDGLGNRLLVFPVPR